MSHALALCHSVCICSILPRVKQRTHQTGQRLPASEANAEKPSAPHAPATCVPCNYRTSYTIQTTLTSHLHTARTARERGCARVSPAQCVSVSPATSTCGGLCRLIRRGVGCPSGGKITYYLLLPAIHTGSGPNGLPAGWRLTIWPAPRLARTVYRWRWTSSHGLVPGRNQKSNDGSTYGGGWGASVALPRPGAPRRTRYSTVSTFTAVRFRDRVLADFRSHIRNARCPLGL